MTDIVAVAVEVAVDAVNTVGLVDVKLTVPPISEFVVDVAAPALIVSVAVVVVMVVVAVKFDDTFSFSPHCLSVAMLNAEGLVTAEVLAGTKTLLFSKLCVFSFDFLVFCLSLLLCFARMPKEAAAGSFSGESGSCSAEDPCSCGNWKASRGEIGKDCNPGDFHIGHSSRHSK